MITSLAPDLQAVDDASLLLGGLPFTSHRAHTTGLSARRLGALVRAGAVRQPVRGVFVDARVPDTPMTRAAAAAVVLPAGSAVCRVTAAWLLGVDARPPGEHLAPVPVHYLVPHEEPVRRRPGIVCHAGEVRAHDLVVIGGVPCTTPLRTACDLLRWTVPGFALAAADALARHHALTPDLLTDELGRWRGERHVAVARRLASFVEPASESWGESVTRLRVLDAGFPRPVVQFWVPPDRPRYRLDMAWPDLGAALEYDGEEFHGTADQQAGDERRRRWIERVTGWQVLAVGRGAILGPQLGVELAVGELLSREPQIRRRAW